MRIVLAFMLILFTMFCLADSKLELAVNIVNRFCESDLKGARLSSDGYDDINDLVVSSDGEPGWDTLMITNSFRVVSSVLEKDNAIVLVEYTFWGQASSLGVEEISSTEIYKFELVRDEYGKWKIKYIPPFPRVSKNKTSEITGYKFKQ